jgi:hypothetical protein
MAEMGDKNPPFHLINTATGKHLGPFSTFLDAALARTVGEGGWGGIAPILNKTEFEDWLRRPIK